MQGTTLEAQVFVPALGAHLLLLTDDVPYEEVLRAYLIDSDHCVVAHTELGGAYAPGLLRDVEVVSDGHLRFQFFEGCWHRLVIDAARRGPRLVIYPETQST